MESFIHMTNVKPLNKIWRPLCVLICAKFNDDFSILWIQEFQKLKQMRMKNITIQPSYSVEESYVQYLGSKSCFWFQNIWNEKHLYSICKHLNFDAQGTIVRAASPALVRNPLILEEPNLSIQFTYKELVLFKGYSMIWQFQSFRHFRTRTVPED